MIKLQAGPCWRIAPCGTTQVYLLRYSADGASASVCSRIGQRGWAKQPLTVASVDLFLTRPEARAEYKRRRALADPRWSLNLATDNQHGQMFIKDR